jgi:hypothetical protein
MDSSDTQPDPTEATTQEKISDLTDNLEQPPTQPTRDVNTFWDRLDSLLENLETTRDTNKKDVIHSLTNQPERVNISSQDDINVVQATAAQEEESYSSFRVPIKRPFLDVKSIQLLRASIPNAVTNIPDSECVFWYYRLPLNAASTTPAPSINNLFMVRLLPSYYKPELIDEDQGTQSATPLTTYGWNRTFNSYQDLASELAKSCLRDLLEDSSAGNPYFIPGDISITYNEQLNRFQFRGNNVTVGYGYRYLAAGYDDPNVWQAADNLEDLTLQNDYPAILGIPGQPYYIGKTLNTRLGFTWNGIYNPSFFPIPFSYTSTNISIRNTLYNRLRPVPLYDPSPPPPLLGSSPYLTPTFTANTYADLVYTNTISLYADFVAGATYDSVKNTQLLACVPMNASNLGVTFYNTTLYCPLTKISDQIYEIEIRMLTDTGQPYSIPNSAIVSLELALTY